MPPNNVIPKEYQVRIVASGLDGGQSAGFQDFETFAWVPAVVDLSTESMWNAPFQSLGDGAFTAAIQQGGSTISNAAGVNLPLFSGRFQAMTKAYWMGSSPIRMTLPLEFRAIDSSKKDVTERVKQLHLLTLPLQSGTDLIPPGPDRGIQVGVEIGNVMAFPDVIVLQVGSEMRMIMDEEGFPVKAVVRFQFQTRKIVTQQDFESMFLG